MHISTVVPQKYFNGVTTNSEKDKYLKLISENFNEIGMIAFGQLQFLTKVLPESEESYNWNTIDNFLKFARNNNIKAHYNTVINNKNSFPEWYWNLSPQDKIDFLERHVKTIISRYKDQFHIYKLVNEVVRDNEENFFGTGLAKTEVVSLVFKWAQQECSNTKFMINDFGNFYKSDIRQKYINLINEVQASGANIDIVGLQGHMWTFELPTDAEILQTLKEIHEGTKLPIRITEFDISYDSSLYGGEKINPNEEFTTTAGIAYENWFEYQAYAYKHFVELCKSTDFVTDVTLWGFVDENVPWERPGIGIINESFKPKPAYTRLKNCALL